MDDEKVFSLRFDAQARIPSGTASPIGGGATFEDRGVPA